jgi:hypothetical protein
MLRHDRTLVQPACESAGRVRRRFVPLLPRLGQEFIQCPDDLLTFVAQRFYKIAELVNRD